MNAKTDNEYKDLLWNLLKRYLLKSRRFCDKYCHPDGLTDILISLAEFDGISNDILYSNKLSDDFDYFIFTKCTKTLHAIRTLLKDKKYYFNEDVMILIRSIFEGHLASRYFRENIDNDQKRELMINEFIKSPIGLITNYYFQKSNIVKDKKGNKVAEVKGPSKFKKGEDENYYSDFYPFLCKFTHNSFGMLKYYFDGAFFLYEQNNYYLETLLFAVFSFSKLFEGITTVWGENFDSQEEEQSYYDLAYDSIELQEEIFNYLIFKYDNISIDHLDWVIQLYLGKGSPESKDKKFQNMLVKMRRSLYEELGSLKKNKVDENGKFVRQYPCWD